jgi:hypothetical protein
MGGKKVTLKTPGFARALLHELLLELVYRRNKLAVARIKHVHLLLGLRERFEAESSTGNQEQD